MLFGRLDVLNPFLTYDRMGLLGSNPCQIEDKLYKFSSIRIGNTYKHGLQHYQQKCVCIYSSIHL